MNIKHEKETSVMEFSDLAVGNVFMYSGIPHLKIKEEEEGLTFRGANLRHATLRSCNLRGCDLGSCDLFCADLTGSDLRGADLQDTLMKNCALDGALLDPVSAPLREFYQELQGWIEGGHKKHRIFKKGRAICGALEQWESSNANSIWENERHFAVRGLDTNFPFNGWDGWMQESRCATFYENPKCLAFIKEMAQ